MKQEIPKPIVVAAIVVVAVLACFFGFKVLQGPPPMPDSPKLKVGADGPVPSYLKGKVDAKTEQMIQEQTQKYGTTDGK